MFDVELCLGPLVTNCLIGIVTISLFYWYATHNHDYWKKRGVPYAKPFPLFGSTKDEILTPLQEVELERYFRLGPIYGYFKGNAAYLSIGDPALIRKILVKDFQCFTTRLALDTGDPVFDSILNTIKGGDDWKRIRSIVSPVFSTGKLKRMMSILKECSKTLVQNLKSENEKGNFIDIKRLNDAFIMDAIVSSAFSTKLDSHNDPDNKFIKTAKLVFAKNVNLRLLGYILAPRLMKFFGISVSASGVMEFYTGVAQQLMEERKRTGQVRNDFLQILMESVKEVPYEQKWDYSSDKQKGDIVSNLEDNNQQMQILKNAPSKSLSMDELVGQCISFFLAGFVTTTSSLSFIMYMLSLHPDVQDRVRTEVDETLEESKGELTYEAIQSMKYLANVISESMRLYPSVIRLQRYADEDYKLGDTGITIPKGMVITIPTYAIHRDPKFYPNPEEFNPDRFIPEERAKRDQYSYLPFSVGPRNCVGMRFALLEIKVCIAHVIANFNIKRCSETKFPPEITVGVDVLQPKCVIVDLEERNDKPQLE